MYAPFLLVPQRLDPAASPSFRNLTLTGYLELPEQSAPSTPTNGLRLFADTSNRLSWKGENGFVRTFDGSGNTTDRIYTLPDFAGTVGLVGASGQTGSFYATSFRGLNGQTFDGNASGEWRLTANGTNQSIVLVPSGTGQVLVSVGSASAPGYGFNGDASTGMYRVAANRIGFSVGGASRFVISNNGTTSTFVFTPNASLSGLSTTTVPGIRVASSTVSDGSSSGTVAAAAGNSIGAPTVAANSTTTFTVFSTFRIDGAPVAGSNVTLTEALALHIASGNSRFDGNVGIAGATATPAGGSASARLVFGTTAGFGIYFGSGAPSVSAAKGSIYLRSDGSGTGDRFYVNTDGGTTWTAATTAA